MTPHLPGTAWPTRAARALVLLVLFAPGVGTDTEVAARQRGGGAAAGLRLALVIGNAAYPKLALENPVNDSQDMANALRGIGFEVIERPNVTGRAMRAAVQEFVSQLPEASIALVFFAGHGVQIEGENYLVPVDVVPDSSLREPAALYSLSTLIREIRGSDLESRRTNVVIIDACRNLIGADRAPGRPVGMARLRDDAQTFVAFASAFGTTAQDGQGMRNSPYTRALLSHVATPGLSLPDLFQRVRTDVTVATRNQQTPREESGLTGYQSVTLVPAGLGPAAPSPGANPGPRAGATPTTGPAPRAAQPSLVSVIRALPEPDRFGTLRDRLNAFSYQLSGVDVAALLALLPAVNHQGAMMLLVPTLPDAMAPAELLQMTSAIKESTAHMMMFSVLGQAGKLPATMPSRDFVAIALLLNGVPRSMAIQALKGTVREPITVDDMIALANDPTSPTAATMVFTELLAGRTDLDGADATRLINSAGKSDGINQDAARMGTIREVGSHMRGPFTAVQVRDIISTFTQPTRLAIVGAINAANRLPRLSAQDRTMLLATIGGPNPDFTARQFDVMFPR